MSYSSHRGLNVSQYIANLNSIEPIDFPSSKQHDDLSLFSNTQFFDFDMGRSTDAGVTVDDLRFDQERDLDSRRRASTKQLVHHPQHQQQRQQQKESIVSPPATIASAAHTPAPSVQAKVDFDFLSADYMDYSMPVLGHHPSSHPQRSNPSNPGPHDLYTPLLNGTSGPIAGHHTPLGYPGTPTAGAGVTPAGIKRTNSSVDLSQLDPEDSSRLASEEDKRRRNTAASARFRIKKKQREQQMERTAKEMQEKVQQLEAKIMQLEMENKWLKNLVVEKNEAKAVSEILSGRQGGAAKIEEELSASSAGRDGAQVSASQSS
ncbi:hypothetical protein POJ06DRAFT_262219 [Lipomyces tetrasporus]|uniref:BZIP domain-containing protein n=1 Tax=Lipomyces tetrasporus TaxID=54092 RepID=A0AAD7VQ03_9ASCO|nr:uncharacterized protein POJ06DRAFT_262219 [Lipomyces tetrasporus]KAJ8096999.1 hypothetical protein POJ06DRAFT_262219 [Lipomyces tetrasporus]